MVQAVFCDFYGTLVHEDGEVINAICQEIMRTGRGGKHAANRPGIGGDIFQEGLPPVLWRRLPDPAAAGTDFPWTRRSVPFTPPPTAAPLSLLLFEHWQSPPAFEDSGDFLARCPVPVLHRLQHRPRGHLGRDPASQFFPQQACSPARTRNPTNPGPNCSGSPWRKRASPLAKSSTLATPSPAMSAAPRRWGSPPCG